MVMIVIHMNEIGNGVAPGIAIVHTVLNMDRGTGISRGCNYGHKFGAVIILPCVVIIGTVDGNSITIHPEVSEICINVVITGFCIAVEGVSELVGAAAHLGLASRHIEGGSFTIRESIPIYMYIMVGERGAVVVLAVAFTFKIHIPPVHLESETSS